MGCSCGVEPSHAPRVNGELAAALLELNTLPRAQRVNASRLQFGIAHAEEDACGDVLCPKRRQQTLEAEGGEKDRQRCRFGNAKLGNNTVPSAGTQEARRKVVEGAERLGDLCLNEQQIINSRVGVEDGVAGVELL